MRTLIALVGLCLFVPFFQTAMMAEENLQQADGHKLFGKLIDDDEKLLPGIRIELIHESQRDVFTTHTVQTDDKGVFGIENVSVGFFNVKEIHIKDYLLEPSLQKSFPFGEPRSKGMGMSHKNPWLIRMWKKRGATEPLIEGKISIQCASDGTPLGIDLLHPPGTLTLGVYTDILDIALRAPPRPGPDRVDLKVSLTRSKEDKHGIRSAWSFSVEAPDGGILITDDRFMFEAPDRGYRPHQKWTITPPVRLSDTRNTQQHLFLKARNGQIYGSIILQPYPIDHLDRDANKARFFIRYRINPGASRNLAPEAKLTYGSYEEYLKHQQKDEQTQPP